MKYQNVKKTQTITNTTDKYLLVGNSSDIIAAYDTLDEANQDIDNQVGNIESSKWGVVRILTPGQSDQADYCQSVPLTKSEKEAQNAIDYSSIIPFLK